MRLDVWTVRGRAFHFGQERGLGMERSAVTWPADSLFAALVARLAAREGPQALSPWIMPFLEGNPPFLLTSTFPFAQKKGQPPLLFFPVPLAARRIPQGQSPPRDPKALKRVRFVSEALFRRLMSGESLAALADQARHLQDGAVWLSPDEETRLPRTVREEGRLWKVADRPRVTVGRADNASNLFYVGAVYFAKGEDRPKGQGVAEGEKLSEGAGLWFGVVWRDETSPWKEALLDLLADLGESGLGAERNVGYGQAKIVLQGVVDLPDPRSDAPWVTLSRYLPRREEMTALAHATAAYQLTAVGGWVDGKAKRRRKVHMLTEGATLGPVGHPAPWGQVVDVRPTYETNPDPLGHPVYRYGYALAVGLTPPPTETR